MTIHFNADEIFEIAEKIERNGVAFYTAAAEKFEGKGLDELMRNLAAMEEEHIATFAAMRAEIADKEKEDTIFDPDDEVRGYLGAIADGNVFKYNEDPAKVLAGLDSVSDVLHTAIGFEKDSIIFYIGIRDIVPEKLGRGKIDKIIGEEREHVVFLSNMLKSLKEA